jgi:hypothetical protein
LTLLTACGLQYETLLRNTISLVAAARESAKMPITHLFHVPNLDYPGVRHLHRDPDIIAIDHFASDDECDGLAQLYARSHGRARPSATAPGQEALRTSTTVFPDELEVRWLRERIAQATNIASLEQLEPTKLTRYAAGEYFRKHIDASFLNEKMWAYAARLAGVDEDGVQAPCSWPSRFVTLFLYLNDVDRGGRTRFRWLHSSEGEGGMRGRHARAHHGAILSPQVRASGGSTAPDPCLAALSSRSRSRHSLRPRTPPMLLPCVGRPSSLPRPSRRLTNHRVRPA